MKVRLINVYWLLAIIVTLVAVGCGGSDDHSSSSGPTAYQARGIF